MSELWGTIEIESWRDTPCIFGRPATQVDVEAGHAVFYIEGESEVANESLPKAALLQSENEGPVPVVVIQVEQTNQGIAVGYRPLTGGNGVCMFEELEFVDDFGT